MQIAAPTDAHLVEPRMSARQHSTEPSTPERLPTSVTAPLGEIDPALERFIRGTGHSPAALPPNLQEAILYSLLGPGKRIRPLLGVHCFRLAFQHVTDSLPATDEPTLAAASSVEMVHAFSLIHDDLPGIDNDDTRRGRPTLHKKAGEAMAILAGDSLLTLAFTILVQNYSPVLASRLVGELAAGTNGMIAGQILDTLGGFAAGLSDQQRLEQVHNNKTAALIRAACRMGVLVGLDASGDRGDGQGRPAGEALLQAITRYADAIGLMFQIVDDILDVTQSSEHLGKKAGKDQDAGKLTYPGVLGVPRSRELVAALHQQAVSSVGQLGPSSEPLVQLAHYLSVRTK